jgi:hypothetical protein
MTWATRDLAGRDRPSDREPYLAYTEGNTTMAYFWKKFTITCEPGKMNLYLNGTRIQEATSEYGLDDPGKLIVGFGGDGEVLLRDLKIFDVALSEKDVKQLAEGKTVKEKNVPVWVSAEDLVTGKRTLSIDNKGILKGRFGVEPEVDRSPEVKDLGGRKCVAFNGTTAMLQSDILAPEAVLNDHPFTVEMFVYCEEDSNARALSFTDEVTRRHTSFAVGRGADNRGLVREIRSVNWNINENPTGKWTRLAWVYDGGPETTVRLYRDGKQNAERTFMSLDTIGGYPMCIGGVMNPDLGEKFLFKGGIAEIKVYDYPRTAEEIAESGKQ